MLCHLACWYNNPELALFIFSAKRLFCMLVNSLTASPVGDCFNEFWERFHFYFPIQVVSETHLWRQHYKVAPGSDSALVGDFTPCTPQASDSALDYVLWDWATEGRFSYFQEEQNQISWVLGFAQVLIGSKLANMPVMSSKQVVTSVSILRGRRCGSLSPAEDEIKKGKGIILTALLLTKLRSIMCFFPLKQKRAVSKQDMISKIASFLFKYG